MKWSQAITLGLVSAFILFIGFFAGYYYASTSKTPLKTPFITSEHEPERPLEEYSFPNLRTRIFQARTITLGKEITTTPEFTSYVFYYDALGKKMSGQLNLPTTITADTPVIVLIRGYVPLEIFSTGVGTKNAAAAFAKEGFITIAPDFFGYGESDPEPTDSWQARFEKPIAVIELLKSIKETGIPQPDKEEKFTTTNIGMWAHSNGGQITFSTLVILRESIPVAFWAPVVAPFPYSIMYFSDEDEDEGKGMRIWVSQLEKLYELRQFSFTQYLDGLVGPFQLHHGTNDEAAPKIWSDEFIGKINAENKLRATLAKSPEATTTAHILTPIEYQYFEYPGADHNLQPGQNWQLAISRDIAFFKKVFSK